MYLIVGLNFTKERKCIVFRIEAYIKCKKFKYICVHACVCVYTHMHVKKWVTSYLVCHLLIKYKIKKTESCAF